MPPPDPETLNLGACIHALGGMTAERSACIDRRPPACGLTLRRGDVALGRGRSRSCSAAAGGALQALGEPGGLAAMETLCKLVPPQEVPRIRRAMAALAKAGQEGPLVASLRKELEEVSQKLRKLEGRLDVVETRCKD